MMELCIDCSKVEQELSDKIRERRGVDPNAPIQDLRMVPFDNMCGVCSWEMMKLCSRMADSIVDKMKEGN